MNSAVSLRTQREQKTEGFTPRLLSFPSHRFSSNFTKFAPTFWSTDCKHVSPFCSSCA